MKAKIFFILLTIFFTGCISEQAYESNVSPSPKQDTITAQEPQIEQPEPDLTKFKERPKIDIPFMKHIAKKDDVWYLLYRDRHDEACRKLDKFATTDTDRYRLGYTMLYSSHPENAVQVFEKIAESPYRNYALALACKDAGRTEQSIDIIKKTVFPAPLDYRADNLLYKIYLKDKDYEKAIVQSESINREYPSKLSNRGLLTRKMELQFEAGNKKQALALFDQVMRITDDSYSLRAAKLFKDEPLSASQNKKVADAFYNKKKYKDALDIYKYYITTDQGKNDSKAKFRIARCLDKSGHYSSALEKYQTLFNSNSFDRGWCSFGIVRCLRKLGQYEKAKNELASKKQYWSKSSASAYTIWEGYEIGRETNDFDMAFEYAEELFKHHPSHDLGDNGAVMAGIFAYMANKNESAITNFDKIYTSKHFSSKSFKNLGKFWSTRISKSMGNDSKNTTLKDFYTYHLHDKDFFFKPQNNVSKPLPYSYLYEDLRNETSKYLNSSSLPEDNIHLQWARFFIKLGMIKWADWEYEQFILESPEIKKSTAGVDLFCELAENNLSNQAYELGLDIVQYIEKNNDNIPMSIYKLSYPIFFNDLLWSEASSKDIDPLFVLSVMRQESRYDPYAHSWANARGLMQIIPSTGAMIARQMNYKDFEKEDLFDPDVSVRFGVHHLADLLHTTGNEYKTLAAYNAGIKAVDRWTVFPGADEDMLLFTEVVDYAQTRHYIRVVMENYFRYHDIWKE